MPIGFGGSESCRLRNVLNVTQPLRGYYSATTRASKTRAAEAGVSAAQGVFANVVAEPDTSVCEVQGHGVTKLWRCDV